MELLCPSDFSDERLTLQTTSSVLHAFKEYNNMVLVPI